MTQGSNPLSYELYEELRKIAGAYLLDERTAHTLQPTALVHEVWLRLDECTRSGLMESEERARLIGRAARVMRQVLVDHARRKAADKRGGGIRHVDIDDTIPTPDTADPSEILDLESALVDLEGLDSNLCRLAELRLFAGLSSREAAAVLSVSIPTATSRWEYAKAILTKTLLDEART